MATTYYAIFAASKGWKDLVQVVESKDLAIYLTGKFHRETPAVNYKVWKSNEDGVFYMGEKPMIFNGVIYEKGAH